MIIQPVDWIESDHKFKYIVDVFGRTSTGEVAQVRLTGFQPYFYLKAYDETVGELVSAIESASEKRIFGMKVISEMKLTQ